MGKSWPALDIHVPGCDPQLQDLVLAELDDFQPTAIQEPNNDDADGPLRAFFVNADARDRANRALRGAFGIHILVENVDVPDDDWASRSQSSLKPVRVGRIVVAPPWAADGPANDVTVIVRPSMGFGTGHHATTRLMLEALQNLRLENRTVLDIGCGSGVLAIAAVLLGARSVMGIDIDPDALANAAENAELNRVADRVRFEEADIRTRSGTANVVLANLTGALLERSASKLSELVAPHGHLVASGFMDSEPTVLPALKEFFSVESVSSEEGWVGVTLKNED